MKIFRRAKCILCAGLAAVLFAFAGCARPGGTAVSLLDSYRDIPGITQEVVSAIDDLRSRYDHFVFGVTLSDEAFRYGNLFGDGEAAGFAVRMSEWLTEFFEIEFVPSILSYTEIAEGLYDGTVHFTSRPGFTSRPDRDFRMTDPLLNRFLKIATPECGEFSQTSHNCPDECYFGLRPASSEMRLPRFVFYENSETSEVLAAGAIGDFIAVRAATPQMAAQMVLDGEADAVLGFSELLLSGLFPGFNIRSFHPLVTDNIAFTASDPELFVIVDVVQKALENGGLSVLSEIFRESRADLMRHNLSLFLTEEERRFISENPVINAVASGISYPVSFFNEFDGEFQGIAHDILEIIGGISGLRFELLTDYIGGTDEMLDALDDGRASVAVFDAFVGNMPRIIRTDSFFEDQYAMLSLAARRSVSLNELPLKVVGAVCDGTGCIIFEDLFPYHVNLVVFDDSGRALDALESGEIDLLFYSVSALMRITNFYERTGFRVNFVLDDTYPMAFSLPEEDTVLYGIINKALSVINTYCISNVWMNRQFDYASILEQERQTFLMAIAALLAVTLAMLFIFLFMKQNESRRLKVLVRQRTAELENETAMLNTLFDSMPDILFVKDLDFRYTRVNKNFEALFNITKEEAVGKREEVFATHVPPEVVAEWRVCDERVFSNKEAIRREELVPAAAGKEIIFETIKTPIVVNDEVHGLIGLSRDISLRKTIEEELERASRAKSAFVANMSHEIRTPMNSIVGFSELALAENVPPNAKMYLKKIIENSKWLLQIINDILDVSKIEAGKMELERLPFSLEELMAQCESDALPKAAEKGIRLHFYKEHPEEETLFYGDETRLRQILMNLLTNAIKFTNMGMVRIASAVSEEKDGKRAVSFEIRDSGIGMTAEQINRASEPFTQADISISRKYGGTGLGIPIIKNLLALMGSELTIESELGVGSSFKFDIEFETVDPEDASVYVNQRSKALEKPTFGAEVLVCEDNEMNQIVISDHLTRVGISCMIAENGLIGVDAVRARKAQGKKPFDLIFMDIQMPIMHGLEAAEKINEMGTETPIVAMTANVMASDRELYRKYGMMDTVGKPFTANELWTCLLKYLKPVSGEKDEDNSGQEQDGIKDEKNKIRNRLVASFMRENQNKLEEIYQSLEEGSIDTAYRIVHTLKSTAGLLNKTGLQNAAAAAEAMLRNGENNLTEEGLKNLEKELTDVLAELTPIYEQITERNKDARARVGKAGIEGKRLAELVRQLSELLRMRSADSLSYLDDVRQVAGAEQLADEIESYDFKAAEKTLAELKDKWGIAQ